MAREGKRIRSQKDKVEAEKLYPLEEACELVAQTASAKFDETVDVAIKLGVDPRKADQNVRGSVALPHGLGKEILQDDRLYSSVSKKQDHDDLRKR